MFHKFMLPGWLRRTNRESLSKDFVAGLTGAIAGLPQGIAFASIAGLPPQYGLYTAMVPSILAGLFGSSHHMVSGPTTAISLLVFSTLSPLAEPGSETFITLALTLAFMAGFFQLAMGLARVGGAIDFVSHSVVIGFTCGAAVLIATSQLKHLFGLPLPNGDSFLNTWIGLFHSLSEINYYVLAVGVTTLLTSIVAKRWIPYVPNMLSGMVVGSLLAVHLGIEEHHIALVGTIPEMLPPLSLPDLSLGTIRTLASGAFAIALLGLITAVSISRSIGLQSKQRIRGSQEFIGQGISNLVGSFFSAYPSSGSFTRSGINYRSGAQTPFSSIFAALFLMGIVLLIAPLASYLPLAAMAGIILQVAYNLIDDYYIGMIIKSTKPGTAVMFVTFLVTLFMELEFAIFAGVILSLSFYLNRTSRPSVVSMVPNPRSPWRQFVQDDTLQECPQLKIIRIDGSLYFGSTGHVGGILRQLQERRTGQKNLMIIGSGINFIDLSGADLLRQEADERRKMGGHLFLFDIKEQVCQMFKRSGHITSIGRNKVFQSKKVAIRTILAEYHDHEQCRTCGHRVFLECGTPYEREA